MHRQIRSTRIIVRYTTTIVLIAGKCPHCGVLLHLTCHLYSSSSLIEWFLFHLSCFDIEGKVYDHRLCRVLQLVTRNMNSDSLCYGINTIPKTFLLPETTWKISHGFNLTHAAKHSHQTILDQDWQCSSDIFKGSRVLSRNLVVQSIHELHLFRFYHFTAFYSCIVKIRIR